MAVVLTSFDCSCDLEPGLKIVRDRLFGSGISAQQYLKEQLDDDNNEKTTVLEPLAPSDSATD